VLPDAIRAGVYDYVEVWDNTEGSLANQVGGVSVAEGFYDVTVDEVKKLTNAVLKGSYPRMPPDVDDRPDTRELYESIQRDVAEMKAKGITAEIPFEMDEF
jgi:hypothetical protein